MWPGDAGGPRADHQGSGDEAVVIRPAEEQTARPQLLRDSSSTTVWKNEPRRLPVSTHHVSLHLSYSQSSDTCLSQRLQQCDYHLHDIAAEVDQILINHFSCCSLDESEIKSLFLLLIICFCRSELRERIQPEILELIKQQRLNRLCEGSCFRKLGNRRRQGTVSIQSLCFPHWGSVAALDYQLSFVFPAGVVEKFWFCRLSLNHKVLHYGDLDESPQGEVPFELLSDKSKRPFIVETFPQVADFKLMNLS